MLFACPLFYDQVRTEAGATPAAGAPKPAATGAITATVAAPGDAAEVGATPAAGTAKPAVTGAITETVAAPGTTAEAGATPEAGAPKPTVTGAISETVAAPGATAEVGAIPEAGTTTPEILGTIAATPTPEAVATSGATAASAATAADTGAAVTVGADVYLYKVLPDESWTIVAGRTGVPIAALQAANPQAIRDNEWLLTNEVLQIPVRPQPGWPRSSIVIYTVQPGESWNSIAADFLVSPTLLWAVNPHLRRPWGVLITGDQMFVPPAPRWSAQ